MTDEMKEKIFNAILNASRNDAVLVQLEPFEIEVYKDFWSNDKTPFDAHLFTSFPCKNEWIQSGTMTTRLYEKSGVTRLVHHGEYLGDGRYGRDIIDSIRDKSLHCRMESVDNGFVSGCQEQPKGSRYENGVCSYECRIVTFVYWSKR
jgi:hypothetical protein